MALVQMIWNSSKDPNGPDGLLSSQDVRWAQNVHKNSNGTLIPEDKANDCDDKDGDSGHNELDDEDELEVYSWRGWQGGRRAVSMKVDLAGWSIIFFPSSFPFRRNFFTHVFDPPPPFHSV